MRMLHVAALPFPSPQGTQALLHQMLSALAAAGHEVHLLCYAHGATVRGEARGTREPPRLYTVHRIPARGFTRSLRSGPSLDKLWLDVSLARRLATLMRELTPERVVAHHVEAAACVLAQRVVPATFVAHTSLSAELPTYFSPGFRALTELLGRQLDRALIHRATETLAVSPMLAHRLTCESGRPVRALALPWPVAAPITDGERAEARAQLGLSLDHEVALYAGNLDAYQGLEGVLEALSRLAPARPRLRVLIATAADTTRLSARLRAHGLAERARFTELGDEPARRRAHAATDLALVPRHSPGGVPIKLLDAFARAVPVVAARRALAGLEVAQHCSVIDGDCPSAWEHAIVGLLDELPCGQRRAQRARAYLAREHQPARFVAQLA